MRPDLTMVVPTYNERDRLGTLLERIFTSCEAHSIAVHVVIVDDNSTDGTSDLADEWARRAAVQVIHRPGKLGLGSAVLDGLAIANSDIVGVMDADLSHPPDLIPILYEVAVGDGKPDMVVASRYVKGGGARSWSAGRLLLSRLGCWLSRPLTPVQDAMSGFFLLRRDRALGFKTTTQGFKIGLELLVRIQPRHVAEVGYVFVGREAGESKMSVGEALRFLRQLVRLYASSWSTSAVRPSHLIVPAPPSRPQPTSPVRTVMGDP